MQIAQAPEEVRELYSLFSPHPEQPPIYKNKCRHQEQDSRNPCCRITEADRKIAESGHCIKTDQHTCYHSETPESIARLVYPAPWMVYRRIQSNPKTGKKDTEICRNNSVSFNISSSDASTKSKANVRAPTSICRT